MTHAGGEPVPARPSATVILARDGERGLEVYMVQRHQRSSVLPSVLVFPGGVVDPGDHVPRWVEQHGERLAASLGERADSAPDPGQAVSLYVCAIRESFEEAGVLLAGTDGRGTARLDGLDAGALATLAEEREALQSGRIGLAEVLEAHGWVPSFGALVPFSHWVTPVGAPARFDARFFVTAMPPGQEALACQVETDDGLWIRPVEALDAGASGERALIFPTVMHLRRVQVYPSVAELLAFAQRKPIRRTQPVLRRMGGTWQPELAPELEDEW